MRTDVVIEVLEIGGLTAAEVLEAPPLGTDAPAVAPVAPGAPPGFPGRGDDDGRRVTAGGRGPVSSR
jgi:hypothetical protein